MLGPIQDDEALLLFALIRTTHVRRVAEIGGYHGYGGRLAQWIESLEKLAAWRPDVLVPARNYLPWGTEYTTLNKGHVP